MRQISLSLFVAIVFRCCHSRIVDILFSKKEGRQFVTKRVTELKQRFEYKLNVLCLGLETHVFGGGRSDLYSI